MYKDIEEEEHSSGSKLIKLMDPYDPQEWSHGEVTVPNCCLDAADEPSPLGLRLEKTPSLVDLIQLNLSQKNLAGSEGLNSINQETELTEDSSSAAAARAGPDKRKATNFSASVLRIGTWECVSRYEGDLVVKCYFAKRKLVWEVLEGGLKSKIEIQWSDITALKASCPDHQLGTLDIELSRPPTFFKESNPQPRKHTLWQTTSDFTGGQATIYRRHILQFFPGVLDRHYEKLIQCDSRLNMLSKKGIVGMGSPYFESIIAPFQNQAEQRLYWALQENKSHVLAQPAYLFNDYDLTTLSSLSDAEIVMAPSLVPKFEHFNPEEKLYGNTVFPRKDARSSNKIDEIAQYLLSDSLVSDDQSIITRVNSMCSFLQEDINREGSWFR